GKVQKVLVRELDGGRGRRSHVVTPWHGPSLPPAFRGGRPPPTSSDRAPRVPLKKPRGASFANCEMGAKTRIRHAVVPPGGLRARQSRQSREAGQRRV